MSQWTPPDEASRAHELPCGCFTVAGVRARICPEAARLWELVCGLGDVPLHESAEYQAYQQHFQRSRKR